MTLIASAVVSPFELVRAYNVVPAAPLILAVWHGDFHGMPTPRDPAVAGELLAVQATGIGPVSPTVATGAAAPDAPLSYAQLPVTCSWGFSSGEVAAMVQFAGLAPELVGQYQINVLVPPMVPLSGVQFPYLSCAAGGRMNVFPVYVAGLQ